MRNFPSFVPSFAIRAASMSACLALVSMPESAAACPGVLPELCILGYVEADYELSAQPPGVSERVDFDEPVAAFSELDFVVATPGSSAHARVVGDAGWARVVGTATASMINPGDTDAGLRFLVRFADRLTITSPGRTGNATVTMGANFSGGVSSALDGFGSSGGGMGAGFQAPGLNDEIYASVNSDLPGVPPAETIEEWLGGEATIQLGVPFTFFYWLELYGSAGAGVNATFPFGATATFVGDFGQTIEWTGLSDLRDEQGNPIDEFEVSSLSGADYRHPIPEPARALGVAIGAAALGLLVGLRRRGRERCHVRCGGSLAAGLLVGSLAAGAASAFDGVLEINQVCAVQTGCFSGDTPGFPITIDGSAGRSYRLTGSLVVPDEFTDGISISGDHISIDLAGFEIRGPVVCSGTPLVCTPSSGSGAGIEWRFSNQIVGHSIRNGSIRGMGSYGIRLGNALEVKDVRVHSNRLDGIVASFGAILLGNVAQQNGGSGIVANASSTVSENSAFQNGVNGIVTGVGSTISRSSAYLNGGAGIVTALGSVVVGCSAYDNDGDGISATLGARVSDSNSSRNGGDGINASTGATITGCTAYDNIGDGIEVGLGSLVSGSGVRNNDGFGLRLASESGYRENVVSGNSGGSVTGGVDLGANLCNGLTTCP